ncbi:MAG: 2-oxoacid:ferredoxin oxidoreductase subunit beta [Candidatus Omnitrophica bacterium]|nr:2-oxoacid:ferredoxin oxidoreductase subunit beta [Candidatus Omnitrophota bacterium]
MSPTTVQQEFTPQDYKTDEHPIWCPGCGDFGVLSSLYQSLVQLHIHPKNLVVVSGIGCSGRTPGFVKSYGFHVVHGRVLPVALGVKVANPKLTVLGVGGDGDGFAIGGGHIPHAARRNVDITYLVMDNSTYGLTKGQYSPTSPKGFQAGSTPYGNIEKPLNPLAMLIAYGATFVAAGYSGKPKELAELITRAIEHKGFAFVNILSPCITFYNTYKVIPPKIAEVPKDHDVTNRVKAFELALRDDKIHLGIFYQAQEPTFEDGIAKVVSSAQASTPPRLDEIFAEFA